MLQFVRAIRTSDGKTHDSISEAQIHELVIKLSGEVPGPTEPMTTMATFARLVVEHKDAVIDILTTTESSLPKARAINGGRKNRKAKGSTETPATTPAV